MRVCVLEAGGDPRATDAPRLPDDYDVPAFHAFASENAAMSWNFHVRHYADEARQARDPKYDCAPGRALSARGDARRLHRAQRDDLHAAARFGLESHRRADRRPLVARARACAAMPGAWRPATIGRVWRALRRVGIDPTGHGWDGWLSTERSVPLEALGDDDMVSTVARDGPRLSCAACPMLAEHRAMAASARATRTRRPGDASSFEGLCYTPLSTERPPARGRARAPAAGGRRASRAVAHRARCAGHARAVRQRRRGQRRRVPEGAAPVPGTRDAAAMRRPSAARCTRGAR